MDWLDSVSSSLLKKDLDGLWMRQQAISDNMANFETPGYKQKNVSFEDQLRAELESTDGTPEKAIGNIQDVSPVLSQADDQTFRNDGNGVDLEQQMIEMFRTTLNYSSSLQMTNDNFSRLKIAITGTAK